MKDVVVVVVIVMVEDNDRLSGFEMNALHGELAMSANAMNRRRAIILEKTR